tara:strand:+ start:142 stop:831 length:690 start_codon:yes stop_codon:yes gene_type:complete
MSLTDYIRSSDEKVKKEHPHSKLFGVDVLVQNPLPENVNLARVLKTVERMLPPSFVRGIDMIYVGRFPHLDEREVNSMYMHGAIFITNEQDDEGDILDDLVHEIAHHVETRFAKEIYMDGKIKKEFLGKRMRLEKILRFHGIDTSAYNFADTEYSDEFDSFLYKKVGYDKMEALIMGLFPSPYAATSLREYFAIGFESYYLEDANFLQDITPQLFIKIEELNRIGENND